jgi:hypothetical protein
VVVRDDFSPDEWASESCLLVVATGQCGSFT